MQVLCVSQGGVHRCTPSAVTSADSAHRDVYKPLDVGPATVLTGGRALQMVNRMPVDSPRVVDETLAEKTLMFMGFRDGVATTSSVRLLDVRKALATNTRMSAKDRVTLQRGLGVTLFNLHLADARRITRVVQRVVQSLGATLTKKPSAVNARGAQVYKIKV